MEKRTPSFRKHPPHLGCGNCGGSEMRQKAKEKITARMNTRIYGGFGGWTITKNGEVVYFPPDNKEWGDYPTLMKFENMARKDPDNDWRAELYTPMRGATYQRQGKNEWVLIATNDPKPTK